jgi:DNA methylase
MGGRQSRLPAPGRGINQPQALNPRVGYPTAAHRAATHAHPPMPRPPRRDCRLHAPAATPADHVVHRCAVFAEAARVLAADGAAWLDLGDCYRGAAGRAPTSRNLPSGGARLVRPRSQDLSAKNLLGVPWWVAVAEHADGVDPQVRGGLAQTHAMPDRVVPATRPLRARAPADRMTARTRRTATLGDVWSIPTGPLTAAHLALVPIDRPHGCIAAGGTPAGVVLDRFGGAGTTGCAAVRHGRRYLGIDPDPADDELTPQRLAGAGARSPA